MVHCEESNHRSKGSTDHALHWHDDHNGDASNEVVITLSDSVRLPWCCHLMGRISDYFPPLALEGQAVLSLARECDCYFRRRLSPTLHRDIERHVQV